jgi:hypothetical protein
LPFGSATRASKPPTDTWKADLKLKEKALQKLAPAGQAAPRFQADDPLLAFLKKL